MVDLILTDLQRDNLVQGVDAQWDSDMYPSKVVALVLSEIAELD